MAENDPITSPDEPKVKCKFDEMVDTSALTHHPKNPNKHSKDQIKRLAQILKYQGFRHTIIVSNFSGFIVVGHGRLEAAKLNGWEQVPIERQNFDDEAAEYAFMISDNAIGEWAELDLARINNDFVDLGPDFDVDLLGIKDFSIEPFDKYDNELEDDVPEEPKEAKTKLGELWILGEHRLLCGDFLIDSHKLMNDKLASIIYTDPPYGINLKNKQGQVTNDHDLEVFKSCLPVLKEHSVIDSHVYVWCAPGDKLPESIWCFSSVFEFKNLLPIRCIHENKRNQKGAYKYNYECCLFANNNAKGFNPSDKFEVSKTTLNDNRYKGDGKLKVYPSLFDEARSTEHNMNLVHPTQKNVRVIKFHLEISSNQNDICLDPFGGSGSTLIACEKTGRKCFMMEIEPKYIDVILSRWSEYTGEDPIREDGTKWSELNTGT